VVSGKHILLYDCKNAFIQIPKDKIAVVQGLNNVIVVEKDNVLLICSKDQEQMIRTFVNDVKVKKGERYV
jgi:mannose-1-phosphate guanylyltransferase